MAPSSPATDAWTGRLVGGRWRIVSLLDDSGGMASVYLARDERLERQAVVKMPKASHLNEEFAERFAREAKWHAKVENLHVVQILDRGEEAGGDATMTGTGMFIGTLQLDAAMAASPLPQPLPYVLLFGGAIVNTICGIGILYGEQLARIGSCALGIVGLIVTGGHLCPACASGLPNPAFPGQAVR